MTLKYHFFNYRTVFPVQKVSFLAAKIPMGRKSFLSLSARKKRKRYRRKKCPIIKKVTILSSQGTLKYRLCENIMSITLKEILKSISIID